jgi:hypothetical protein
MPTCSVHKHPDRDEIDRQIVAGVPLRTISTNFNIALGTVHRHKDKCVKQALADAMRSRESENAERGPALLNRVEKLVGEAEEILASAKSKSDFRGANGALGAACKLLDLCGRLSGQLQSANTPGLHLTMNRITNNTIINYDNDVDFARMIQEATKDFNPTEIQRLKLLAESVTVQQP